jgi:very-short-patch-repair endonuclease
LNCKVCGKEFEAFPAEIEYGRKFCSTECAYSENGRNLKRVEQVKCVCKVCCKEFTVPPSAIKKGNGIVCSRECLIKWKTTEKEVSCKGCGTKFMRQDSHIPKYKVNYCSSECWYRYGLPETQKEMTDIEVKMKDELDKRGIEYEMQQWVEGICCADFLLPGKVIIMCDGDYWHRLPMRPQRDGKQNFRLRAKGYKVFRFWGTDINRSIEECIDTLIGCMGW